MTKHYRKYIQKVCEQCGITYTVRADIKASRFCSIQCGGLSRRMKPIKCEHCGIEFIPSKNTTKFCSNECAGASRRLRENIKCDYCNKEFERHSCHINDVINFCSVECYGKWVSENKTGKDAFRWKGGIYKPYDKYISIRQTDGTYKQEHRIVMENHLGRKIVSEEIVHHIDGNGKNNDIDNLQLMDRPEHGRIHTTERWETGTFFKEVE